MARGSATARAAAGAALLVAVALHALASAATGVPCQPLDGACLCNATVCDTVPPVPPLSASSVAVYETSEAGARLHLSVISAAPLGGPGAARAEHTITVDLNATLQTLIGFGGAMTDAAALNIESLPGALQELLLAGYYDPAVGLAYSLGRTNMGGCDFSPRVYTLDDVVNDFELQHFGLEPEDELKIGMMKRANAMSGGTGVQWFASPWSAPGWMKTTGEAGHGGALIGTAGDALHKTWAKYFSRFLSAYAANNITFFGVTAQNEPADGMIKRFPFNAMLFTPETQRDFVKMDLGPELRASHPDVQLMIFDDQRAGIEHWADVVYGDANASQYVSGTAVHWYEDFLTQPGDLTKAHHAHPDKFILNTEACTGEFGGPKIGDWERGQRYANDIITDLQNYVAGWCDWNIALNQEGGPNWAKNYVDAPVIVDAANQRFLRNPMFYVLGHFSKFLQPGAVRLESTLSPGDALGNLKAVAFRAAGDGAGEPVVVVVVLNMRLRAVTFAVEAGGIRAEHTIPRRAVQTLLLKPR